MDPSWPLIEVAIETRRQSDGDRLLAILAARATEEPSLRFVYDRESGQTMLGGLSELQLDVEVGSLHRQHGLDLSVGAPQVVYRETVTRRGARIHTDQAPSGRPSRFARVEIVVEPNAAGAGTLFVSRAAGGVMPLTYVPAVRSGVASALRAGVLMGYPVADVLVTLTDLAYHDRDSCVAGFQAAALAATRAALVAAGPVLLEPVMAVEVRVLDGGACAVADDLRARGGDVRRRPLCGEVDSVGALVPLVRMLGYAGRLRSLTGGRSWFEMEFAHHRPVVPRDGDPPLAVAAAMRA